MNRFKPSLAALGLSAALAAGSASAALTLDENGVIFLEDDDIDFHFDSDLNPVSGGGLLQVGDVLVSVVEFNEANGDNIEDTTGSELTGVLAGQIRDISGIGTGTVTLTFGAYEDGLNSILSAYGGPSVTDGDAGEGALAALWLGDPDLDIGADDVSSGTVSCDSLAECVAQATDGDLWEVDGFTGANGDANPAENEFWASVSPEAALDTSAVLATNPAIELIAFNIGASLLFDGSGLNLAEGDGVACFPFCAPGETVDVLVGGSVKGGAGLSAGLQEDGAVGTSDFDLTKTGAIPEPSALALLAAGFIGIGAARLRRRRKA